jgi:excisionase family DNA binding protein
MRPELWTIDEAATYLGWTPTYVRRLSRAKRLPAIKLGREWRFDPDQLIRWVHSGQPTAAEQPSLFGVA